MNSKLFLFLSFCLILLPAVAFAQFQPMVSIPGVDAEAQVGDYINALYILAISIAAFLAVIKLIIAGVKYMLTDVVPSKQSAKNDIKGALIGLLIVIGAALILQTINPNLRVFSIFDTGLNCDGQDYCEEAPPAERDGGTNQPVFRPGEEGNVETIVCSTNCSTVLLAQCGERNQRSELVTSGTVNTYYCYTDTSTTVEPGDGTIDEQDDIDIRIASSREDPLSQDEWNQIQRELLRQGYSIDEMPYNDSRSAQERCVAGGRTSGYIYYRLSGPNPNPAVAPRRHIACI